MIANSTFTRYTDTELSEMREQFKTCHRLANELTPSIRSEYFPVASFQSHLDAFFRIDDLKFMELMEVTFPCNLREFFRVEQFEEILNTHPEFIASVIALGVDQIISLQFDKDSGRESSELQLKSINNFAKQIRICWSVYWGIQGRERLDYELRWELSQRLDCLKIDGEHSDILWSLEFHHKMLSTLLKSIDQPEDERTEIFNELIQDAGEMAKLVQPFKSSPQTHVSAEELMKALQTISQISVEEEPHLSINTPLGEDNRSEEAQLESRIATTSSDHNTEMDDHHSEFVFSLVGEIWKIRFNDEEADLKDSKGLRYIHTLLSSPGHPIRADILGGGGKVHDPNLTGTKITSDIESDLLGEGSGSDISSTRVIELIEAQLEELRDDLNAMIPGSDEYFLQEERITEMEKYKSKHYNKFGQDRPVADSGDRARSTVTHNINNAEKKIKQSMPNLFAHLKRHLDTGFECIYNPPPESLPNWEL